MTRRVHTRHKMTWTEKELLRLDTMAGRPPAEIGRALGRSVRAVTEKLEESRNQRGDTLTIREAAETYCPHLSHDGARNRIERFMRDGKLRAWRSSWGTKGGHWRIDPDDLEKCRAELAAPRQTWKCDER